MKRTVWIILFVVLLGVFVFSAWKIVDILQEYWAGEAFYADMNQYISVPEAPPETQPPKEETPQATEAEETVPEEEPQQESPWPEVDFDALKTINNQVVGWIYIPDTKVNYPIVQGQNNDQYLHHLLTGEYNSSGSIFLESKVAGDFSGRNNPIYGHNMKNGTMFADLIDYKSQSFYDEHPVGMLMTPEKNYYVRIYSGYVTSSWGNAWELSFSDSRFTQWLQDTAQKSCFDTDVVPTLNDRILTFSTCTYESNDARFVIHAVLEEEIEENQTAAD